MTVVGAQSLIWSIDDAEMYTATGDYTFDVVGLALQTDGWVGNAAYYDDFSFVPLSTSTPQYAVNLLYDPTKVHKAGSTIPIKLQVVNGVSNVSSASLTVHAMSITPVSPNAMGTLEDSGNANPDMDFRFDSTLGGSGGYIYNLSLKGFSSGTYSLKFQIGSDPVLYTTNFRVK